MDDDRFEYSIGEPSSGVMDSAESSSHVTHTSSHSPSSLTLPSDSLFSESRAYPGDTTSGLTVRDMEDVKNNYRNHLHRAVDPR